LAGFIVVSVLWANDSRAQAVSMQVAGITRSDASQSDSTATSASHGRREPSMLVATAASALVPGAGQALLGSRRAIAYVLAEGIGWVAYTRQMRDGDRQRALYRDLSRTVARAQFVPDGPAGDWDYYERMEKFVASGAYDAVPGGGVDPEQDPGTFNGSIWLLARQTYWRDPNTAPNALSPEYQSALDFYERRAVPPALQWSWAGAAEGFQRYRRSIAASNSAFRQAEQTAGLVLANHILSAVDAYVSLRLRASKDEHGRTSLTASIPLGGGH
jgi:hypothetical protein